MFSILLGDEEIVMVSDNAYLLYITPDVDNTQVNVEHEYYEVSK